MLNCLVVRIIKNLGVKRRLHDKTDTDHLLRKSNDESSDLGVCALGIVHWYGHRKKSDSPTCQDSPNQNHGKILSCALKDSSNKTYESSHENCQFSPESVHGEAALKRAKDGASIECRIDGADDIRTGCRVEESKEVLRGNDICHYTCIVSK